MIASRSFTIPTEGTLAARIASVLTPGTPAFVVLALAAVVAVAPLLNVTLDALISICAQSAALYDDWDSALKLLLLLMLGYVLVILFSSFRRSLAA